MEKIVWYSGSYTDLQMTLEQARAASHQGRCDADVEDLVMELRSQLDKLDPQAVRLELKEYGAWGEEELSRHEDNLRRLVWTAAGQIVDEEYMTASEL